MAGLMEYTENNLFARCSSSPMNPLSTHNIDVKESQWRNGWWDRKSKWFPTLGLSCPYQSTFFRATCFGCKNSAQIIHNFAALFIIQNLRLNKMTFFKGHFTHWEYGSVKNQSLPGNAIFQLKRTDPFTKYVMAFLYPSIGPWILKSRPIIILHRVSDRPRINGKSHRYLGGP